MSWEMNTLPVCPECRSKDCIQLDEQKVQCVNCGHVFIHPVLVEQGEQAA
jgi:Zn ribbon nucleic-acid-binding protein